MAGFITFALLYARWTLTEWEGCTFLRFDASFVLGFLDLWLELL
jgi:hypothetical protein